MLIYGAGNLAYDFGPEHPFKPLRLQLAMTLIESCGLLDRRRDLVEPRPASRAELGLAHAEDYIATVERLGGSALARRHDQEPVSSRLQHRVVGLEPPLGHHRLPGRYGLGSPDVPIFPSMHQAAALSVGGTLLAAELVMTGVTEHAFHLAGGHHHAQQALASGFCIYNDITAAIEWLTRQYGVRVLYIDNDAHHGDGVEIAFAERADVLTISFHETGRCLYPGTGDVHDRGHGAGQGYAINVPLEPHTDDDSWLALFEAVVPHVVERFRPDIMILQAGCDGHRLDPLTDLHATTRTGEVVVRRSHQLAHQFCRGRLIVLGGGGYDIWRVVPRAWTLAWAELSDQTAPDLVPLAWQQQWQSVSPVPLPTHLRDDPADWPPLPHQAVITAANAATLTRLRHEGWRWA